VFKKLSTISLTVILMPHLSYIKNVPNHTYDYAANDYAYSSHNNIAHNFNALVINMVTAANAFIAIIAAFANITTCTLTT
jgi:hypothetical protein